MSITSPWRHLLILSRVEQKFMREGCPNCDSVLGLRGNNDAIQECTSQVFEGLITLNDPNTSWVARWQRLDSYVPGTYAVKVTGSVSSSHQSRYHRAGEERDQADLNVLL